MEELNSEFLSAIAQVSATFIGFALLTPVFQAVASGHTFPGEKYILRKVFFMKWSLLLLLPIFVLSYPLVCSLILLKHNVSLMILPDRINFLYWFISILFDLAIIIFYFLLVRRWSELPWSKEGVNPFFTFSIYLLEFLPPLLVGICLLMWFGLFGSIKSIFILLSISGFLFIVRNTGIRISEGMLFRKTDISYEFTEAKLGFVDKVEETKRKRENLIDKIDSFLQRYKNDEKLREELKELKRSVGYSKGEIKNLEYLRRKIEKLYDAICKKDDKITFNDFFEFEKRMEDGKRRIEEFEVGTVTALEAIRSRFPESEYKVKWDDESD